MTTTLTAHGPEDLLAAVPVVLGFKPEESLVMLTFEARRTFHARVDLPPPDEVVSALPELTDALLAPCLANGVGRVVFVFYTADAMLAARVASHLRRDFVAHDLDVFEVLRADGGCWRRVPDRLSGRESSPLPYDALAHPFAAQAVFDGRVTHDSREALRASLDPLPGEPELTLRRQRRLGRPGAAEVGWLTGQLARWVDSATEPGPDAAARALWAIRRDDVRDAGLFALTRESAPAHLRVWTSLLRRAPAKQVPAAAVLVAFAAWQAGHGALAWCALDRCLEVEPAHPLALSLGECLTRAVPPCAWEEVVERSDPDTDSA
jgi:hypothetical protein